MRGMKFIFQTLFLAPVASLTYGATIFSDQFSNSSLSQWQAESGQIAVVTLDGPALGLRKMPTTVLTHQSFPNEFTLMTDLSVTWSMPARLVFAYQDSGNYYSVGITGSKPGVYRTLNGTEEKISDATYDSLLRLPHAGAARASFKIYFKNSGGQITIWIDRSGWDNGRDFEIRLIDENVSAVQKFQGGKIGFKEETTENESGVWIIADNVLVDNGLVEFPRPRLAGNIFVDAISGHDSNDGSLSRPFKTIQQAVDMSLPGDTVVVRSGTYPERVKFSGSKVYGYEQTKLHIKADTRRTVDMFGFDTLNGHFLKIEGFNINHNITNDWTAARGGIWARSNYVEILDCYFHDMGISAISMDGIGNRAAYNRVYKCGMGIQAGGKDWIIEHNEVERLIWPGSGDSDYSRGFGINGVVRNNYFHGSFVEEIGAAHVDGFQTFNDNGEIVNNILIEGNVFEDFSQAVILQDNRGSGSVHDITVRNNIFMGGTIGGAWGICETAIKNLFVENNIFTNILYHGTNFTRATGRIINNIYFQGGGVWKDEESTWELNNNFFYRSNPPLQHGEYDRVDVDPLFKNVYSRTIRVDSWPQASQALISNSVQSEIKIGETIEVNNDNVARQITAVSPSGTNQWLVSFSPPVPQIRKGFIALWKTNTNVLEDFTLQPNSPAIDVGMNIEIPYDKDGLPRPKGAGIDVGPYEYDCGANCHSCVDYDQDGFAGTGQCAQVGGQFDCQDTNPSINPSSTEICDGADNNCDGRTDEGFPSGDADGDGLAFCVDNCPFASNRQQSDLDADRLGDACDSHFTYHEDFERRLLGSDDISDRKTMYDLKWIPLAGKAAVVAAADGKWLQMSAQLNTATFIVHDISFSSFTMKADLRQQWGTEAGLLFYVQDAHNYYFFAVTQNGQTLIPQAPFANGGFYRVKNGQAQLLGSNSSLMMSHNNGDLNQIHSYEIHASTAIDGLHFKILLRRPNSSVVVQHEFVDPEPAFLSGVTGFYAPYAQYNTLRIDEVIIEGDAVNREPSSPPVQNPDNKEPDGEQQDPLEKSEPGFINLKNIYRADVGSFDIRVTAASMGGTLTLYDKQGAVLKTFDLSSTQIVWDGRNASGQKVASGTYVLLLKKEGKTVKKKIVVVK